MTGGEIQVVVEDASWRAHRGLLPRLVEAAEAARKSARLPAAGGLTILLADDARLKTLNRDFRAKNKPTNVLSFNLGRAAGRKTGRPLFPADAPGASYIGDIALAYGVTRREAAAAGKPFADHARHLVVHGVLHLAGHDHERACDAKVMEALEIRILARLGIANPYELPA